MFDKSRWLEIADRLKPTLFTETVRPAGALPSDAMARGESIIFDFGNHYVGRFFMKLRSVGSHQDAPAFLRIKFCEAERELTEDAADYSGWISRGWIQEEQLHVDVLPQVIALPRRYAFRYVKLEVIDVSSKYSLVVEDAWAECTTSVGDVSVLPAGSTALEKQIDTIALRTLRSCMQDVFEDGPKRDRRLWIGDLRLQALVNYKTFGSNDLVKRCLYLFAGTTREDDRVAACVFTEPENQADDTYMMDYSLFFIPTLLDYYEATGDMETLRDLAPLAFKQMDICAPYFDDQQLVKDSTQLGWCFVDWNLDLNKQASAQAIYIYCARAAEAMARRLDMPEKAAAIHENWQGKAQAAMKHLFDMQRGVFVSGPEGQISAASQVWFVLSGIMERQQSRALLNRISTSQDMVRMVTPYMFHHYVHALFSAGMTDKARETMNAYWGGMVEQGADTFYELFNPENPNESPYGSSIVNSYCHAWSCTPAWFLRDPMPVVENPIEAMIFDLDGVLVDTAKFHYLAWKRLAREWFDMDFSEQDNEQFKGVNRAKCMEILCRMANKKIDEKKFEEGMEQKNQWYVEMVERMTPADVLPGAREYVEHQRTKGIKCAIGSASKNCRLVLERTGLDALFNVVVDGNLVSSAKPDPEVFLRAARMTDSIPSKCIVFEDAQAGIDAAKTGGMLCCAIGNPSELSKYDWIFSGIGMISHAYSFIPRC